MKRLLLNGLRDKVMVADQEGNFVLESLNKYTNLQDVTEDFFRCLVNYCSEEVEFEVDGMHYRATCERIKLRKEMNC